jgi:hypothetical protein
MLAGENFDGPHVWYNRREHSRGIAERDWRDERDRRRFDVRGFRNFEPRTSNFGSRLSRMSRASRATVCGAGGRFQHPARFSLKNMDWSGLSHRKRAYGACRGRGVAVGT